MKKATIQSNTIKFPADIIRPLGGSEVEIIETHEGVLLRPAENIITKTRGFLKGKGTFSSKKFLSLKKEEKELEF